MKGKIVTVVLAGLMLAFVNFTVVRAVQPEVATSIALEQFADPSIQTDTASRMLDIFQPVAGLVWLTYIVGSIWWVLPNVKAHLRQTNERTKENEEV